MNWGAVTLFMLAAFGAISLLVALLTDLAPRLGDLVRVLKELRKNIKSP